MPRPSRLRVVTRMDSVMRRCYTAPVACGAVDNASEGEEVDVGRTQPQLGLLADAGVAAQEGLERLAPRRLCGFEFQLLVPREALSASAGLREGQDLPYRSLSHSRGGGRQHTGGRST